MYLLSAIGDPVLLEPLGAVFVFRVLHCPHPTGGEVVLEVLGQPGLICGKENEELKRKTRRTRKEKGGERKGSTLAMMKEKKMKEREPKEKEGGW